MVLDHDRLAGSWPTAPKASEAREDEVTRFDVYLGVPTLNVCVIGFDIIAHAPYLDALDSNSGINRGWCQAQSPISTRPQDGSVII
jgi:hypothetical protein